MIPRRLTRFSPRQLADLQRLIHVLSPGRTLDADTLEQTLRQARLYVVEGEDGRIVACATLCPFCSPTGPKASVEDVVVLPEMQGRGLGRRLMLHLLDEARTLAPITLQLTSRPSRRAANALYRQLGFAPKETNFYKLNIEPATS